jgi:RNA polymerase sigma-70 factor (ECF subfamily)
VYLARTTGDDRLADDLLQETYYRFLRREPHSRATIIAVITCFASRPISFETSGAALARTQSISARRRGAGGREDNAVGDRALGRIDLTRALEQLKPRERSLLWLAYAQGFSHEEIASQLGCGRAA